MRESTAVAGSNPSDVERFLRAILERGRRLRQRHAVEQDHPLIEEHDADERRGRSRRTGDGGTRPTSASRLPAAATISGDGVSPAASAAASGSPPGSAAGDGERRRRALVDLGPQAAQDRALDLRIERLDDGRRRDDAGLLALVDELGEVLAVERALTGEDLVEHEAERVDIAPRRDLVAGELLGRHVGRRAGADRFARRAREPEVGDADLARAVEHHVGRLEIAVDDVALVRRGEAGADLARDLERPVLREAADAPEQRREIFAVHVLHRQERRAVDSRRCRRRGRRSGARPAAPCGLRCGAGSAAPDPCRRPPAGT